MTIDRRTLLIGGGAGVGLIVAYALWPREVGSALDRREGEQVFGHFLRVGTDGRVTVAVPQVETGQGAWTALPQIAADELGAAWEMVGVEPAPVAAVYANPIADAEGWLEALGPLRRWQLPDGAAMFTARSSSVRGFEQPLRVAAAAARAQMVEAAAERWGVSAAECGTADGFVVHEGKRLGFGEVAAAAARLEPTRDAPLRQAGTGSLIGRPLPRLDLPAKSDGSFRFAADVRLPDMLFAAVRLAPPGGRLTAFSRAAAERNGASTIAGGGWLAAVATTGWAAEQALRSARPHFEAPERAEGSDLRALCEAALEGDLVERVAERGDYAAAVAGSRALAATYWVAPAMHLGLEPPSVTARVSGNSVEVWAGTQAPGFARAAAEKAAGAAVRFYPMPVGDSGGRAIEADLVPIAIDLARRVGKPVQATLSAPHAQVQDRLAPPALARMSALHDSANRLSAWRMRVASADGFGASVKRLIGTEPSDSTRHLADAFPPYDVPNVRIDAAAVPLPLAPGYMRGEPERTLTFFTESFIDELARARGQEPLAFRMSMLGGRPRLARCLSRAASLGGWDGGGRGSTLGIAACAAYGSFIGLLADASIGSDQRLAVHRLVAVVDCGRIANSGIVRQQIENGLLWALGQATVREPQLVAGVAKARPVAMLGLPGIAGTPTIQVELIASSADPGGVSGLAPAVLAPALANAVYAGSGRRLRSLPFDPAGAA